MSGGDVLDFDQGSRETLRGTLHDPAATTGHVLTVQADKSVAAAPSGAFQTVQALYTAGATVSVADGTASVLPLGAETTATGLLDLSSPAAPRFTADGTYAVTATFDTTDVVTPGGYFVVLCAPSAIPPAEATSLQRPTSTCLVVKAGARDSILFNARNEDGANALNLRVFSLLLVRLAPA